MYTEIDLSHRNNCTMTDLSWLSAEECVTFFGARSFHEPVSLQRLKNGSILWLNQKVAHGDPHFDGDMAAYERHLLSSCAYVLVQGHEADVTGERITAYADRYGGAGIGNNGGSGRAAIFNGYLVKGIGRTRLVSALTEQAHASGGAYLEESVRDTIYSEIVRAEFPCSAVPVLAIIDTGLVQVWDEASGPKVERRTLVIRPCFLRPAHFERATAFISDNPKEGSIDSLRVGATFRHAIGLFGRSDLAERYELFWLRWARQLAYSFVHRLPHGSNTVSNICLDGKLLDFGAMSALPSWANAATMQSRQSFITQANLLTRLIRAGGYSFGRYLDARFSDEDCINQLAATAQLEYRRVIVTEGLRLCGVTRSVAEQVARGKGFEPTWSILVDLIAHFQREQIDMVESTPEVQLKWDLCDVWKTNPPEHLRELQAIVHSLVASDERSFAANRGALLCVTRSTLYREEAKHAIFDQIDNSGTGAEPDRHRIGNLINEQIAVGRRDHRFAVDDAVPIGFAIGDTASFAIFRKNSDDTLFALSESANFDLIVADSPRHRIHRICATSIEFADVSMPTFVGCVNMVKASGANSTNVEFSCPTGVACCHLG